MTRRLLVDPDNPDDAVLRQALDVLHRGGAVAYPTDTVYGLAVDAMHPEAIARLYRLKQRAVDKALPVIIGALEQLPALVATRSAAAEKLIAAFWPGPLTLLMMPQAQVPTGLLGTSSRIGVRWPQTVLSQQLALGLGRAITATSANRSGAPVALSASDVMRQLPAAVDLILDGGPVLSSEVSTVLDVAVHPPRLYRAGKIAAHSIAAVLEYPVVVAVDTLGYESTPLQNLESKRVDTR
ncbi:Threonylcarbamoyl-AMP synthase [Candidatus Entotheonellaceae bacterium PAL068K]